MADFAPAVEFVLKHEVIKHRDGSTTTYYCDPQTGEESNYGISKAFLNLIDYGVKDPKSITLEKAKSIYQNYFWKPPKLADITSQLIANKLLDMSVNMGQRQMVKILQSSINSVGGLCIIDGLIGPFTLLTIEQYLNSYKDAEERLLEELRVKCCGFYKGIAVGVNAKNLIGWLARANDVGLGEVQQNTLRSGLDDKIVRG